MNILKALPFYHYNSSEYRHIRYRILCHQKGVSYYTAKAKEWKKANPEKVKQQWTKYNHNLKNIEYCKQYYLNQKARINRRNSLFYTQNKHRKETGGANLYVWLRKNNYPIGFQILCYNCNLVKSKVTPERYNEIIKRLRNRKNTLLSNNYSGEF